MRTLNELKSFARDAAGVVAREKDLAEFEVYCSSTEQLVARLNYTSDIPCGGVEEVKSLSADGFAIRIVSANNRHENSIAFEAGDLSRDGVRAALFRARRAMVIDPHFPGLPAQPRRLAATAAGASDLHRVGNAPLVAAAWQIVRNAAAAFGKNSQSILASPGLIVGGDVSLIRDRIALASSNFQDLRADQSAHFTASV